MTSTDDTGPGGHHLAGTDSTRWFASRCSSTTTHICSPSREAFYLAVRWCRDAVAGALGRLVASAALDEAAAIDWAGLLIAGNGRKLYRV